MYIYMLALNYDANSSITYYHCCLVDFEELVHATARKELNTAQSLWVVPSTL